MRSWRKRSATKWAKAPYNTVEATFVRKKSQKLSVFLQNSRQFQKKSIGTKFVKIRVGKLTGRKTRGKSREGRTNRCQRSRETRFVSSFENLTLCYQFEISTKVVKQLGKRIELEKKIWMPKTTLPIEIMNFFVSKTLPCWDREKKERKKTFCRDRFRTLTIVESPSKWLWLIFTGIENPWLCTDWLSEIKRCKKTHVDCYQLAYAGLNGDRSQVCKPGKTIYSGFSKIWNSTYQTYREPSVENKKNLRDYQNENQFQWIIETSYCFKNAIKWGCC